MANLQILTQQVRQCDLCSAKIPLPPRPIFSVNANAKILIAGQAPGIVTHEKYAPFMDKSGARLRDWMGISEAQFYKQQHIAILPMAFCYPGKAKDGDFPPPKICAATWRKKLLAHMPNIELCLLIGKYAIEWHVNEHAYLRKQNTLTETVKDWQIFNRKENGCDGEHIEYIPLPHPSPRNNIWLKKNPWFEQDILPSLRKKVRYALQKC
ncbi:uracil-DNA glycosylase family protein [Glaciecola petra]|uniref:Uracil-DNA glycosylase family protein n=1 Tax=Glaciecola petra TaxID=3075602 RepID=A0ABU2ZQC2_9ALTE|nr:uracil-DNA glycosylase family protein [Aestuariibacter sp. P117]MDT0594823.1 uracil-DNA glycosylase family protein [Aestuariibacter sp. P117]